MKKMFYDDKIMKIKTLRKVWKAGNYQTDSEGDDISLPKICEDLDEWMGSNHSDAHRRLSLRTSAVFVHGAAEVYKKKIQQLLKDVDKIDKEMIFRKRRLSDIESKTGSSETSPESSSTPNSPEQMLLHSDSSPSNISNVNMRKRPKESSLKIAEIDYSLSSCTENTSTSFNNTSEIGSDNVSGRSICTNFPGSRGSGEMSSCGRITNVIKPLRRSTSEPDDQTRESRSLKRRTSQGSSSQEQARAGGSLQRRKSESLQRETSVGAPLKRRTGKGSLFQRRTREGGSSQQSNRHSYRDKIEMIPRPREVMGQDHKKDQAVQTFLSYLSDRREEESNISDGEGFDENLPFGCMLIYDNFNSRIPSQIMFSSINLI